jgi:hypothetical protein
MRRIIGSLSIMALAGVVCSTAAIADDRCGGVLMATKTMGSRGHKALIQNLGFWSIDGGLVMNGESTCTSIRIECERTSHACRTASAITQRAFDGPGVLGVFMSDDYKVTEWTKDTISAELQLLTPGATSYLHIVINDDVPDRAEIINFKQSLVANPGEWVTEVLTVANDPALTKILEKKER